MKTKLKANTRRQKKEIDLEVGYPSYPSTEDIYGNFQKEKNINPEEPSTPKRTFGRSGSKNTKDYSDDMTGDDLDVPGSELDDDMETRGDEDEENNYYSLGGDNHNNLEEDEGDY